MALIRRGFDNPLRELEDLQDRFLSNIFGDDTFTRPLQPGLATPTSDVYVDENNENMVVEAHLPGYTEDDVEVNIEDGALNIRADKSEKDTGEEKGRRYIVRESAASFYRRIGLPKNVETDNISAEFDDGVLKVTVPMQELPKPKKVNIETGKGTKKVGEKNK